MFKLNVYIRRMLDWATIDRVVIFGVLARGWEILAGPVTLILIASHFTPELQGYYYTFGSILSFQMFVELGLGRVIVQFASHEWASLQFNEYGMAMGEKTALSRLASLIKSSLYWYFAAGFVVIIGLGAAGCIFFARSSNIGINWIMPWFALCFISGLDLCFIPVWSVLEGCDQLREVYFFRLVDGILYSITIWAATVSGMGLWAIFFSVLAGFVWGLIFLWNKYRHFLNQLFFMTINYHIDWIKDVWPMQWRIALSWVSGLFVSSLFVPILFYYHGAVVAGKMGMTLSLITLISGVSAVLVLPKAPKFGELIAKKEYKALDKLFFHVTVANFGITSICAAALMVMILFLFAFHHPISLRMLSPLPTGLFLLTIVLSQAIFPLSTYLRAHKKEPYFGLYAGYGILVGLSSLILGNRYGATAIAAGYLAVVSLYLIPVAIIIWYNCRKEWHADAAICQI